MEKSLGNLDVKLQNDHLTKLYQEGSSRAILPNTYGKTKELILINTSGGITSGDKYNINLILENSKLCATTQAAEKIYSGYGDPAKLLININLDENSSLFWLPQEMILFDNCNLQRSINVKLEKNSNLLISETFVFGRTAMGEKIKNGYLSDLWKIYVADKLQHVEAINFNGNIEESISKKTTLNNQSAVNTIFAMGEIVIKIASDLRKVLSNLDNVMSELSMWDDKMIIRTISKNNYYLKSALNKILFNIIGNNLPKIWNI